MPNSHDFLATARTLAAGLGGWARQTVALLATAMAAGSMVAFFLWSLDFATALRFAHPWLLYLLPVAGAAVGLIYHWLGSEADRGHNLLMEQIHEPGGGVPRRMALLVLLGTLATHLCGGSAGREGTAVQMGGSIASGFARWLRLEPAATRMLLMAGVAAGFGAVFGTPLAGAIFALEVLTVGQVEYTALLPCFIAAVAGDWTCHAWGIAHTPYHLGFLASGAPPAANFHLEGWLLGKVMVASVAFGLVSTCFAGLTHGIQALGRRFMAFAPWRPAVGGLGVIALFWLSGTDDYLGLGVTSPKPDAITIVSFFESPSIHAWSWLWKLLFTAVTVGSGFKGGEVTPLFFIGAALGNALAGLLGAPPDLFAALGFAAVFAGATNTPLACTLMGVELFGSTHLVYLATACFVAYLCSGQKGIYQAQRLGFPKRTWPAPRV